MTGWIYHSSCDVDLSINARMILYADIRSNIATHRRFALACIIKEAGLRSPRTQLTKVQKAISVQGRHTEVTNWKPAGAQLNL